MSDPIRDELHRLSEEFRKLASLPKNAVFSNRPSTEQLMEDNITFLVNEFGLTNKQAKTWLEQEPNFVPIRRKETVPKSDTEETEPKLVMFIWKGKTGKNIDLFVIVKEVNMLCLKFLFVLLRLNLVTWVVE